MRPSHLSSIHPTLGDRRQPPTATIPCGLERNDSHRGEFKPKASPFFGEKNYGWSGLLGSNRGPDGAEPDDVTYGNHKNQFFRDP